MALALIPCRRLAAARGHRALDHRARQVVSPFFGPVAASAARDRVLWSLWTISTSSAEVWAAAIALPLTQQPAWLLGVSALALGLPWSPFAAIALSRSLREGWAPEHRAYLKSWLQVALACLVSGTIVPGLAPACRMVVLAGFCVGAAACLETAWTQSLAGKARGLFFIVFGTVIGLWLAVMIYATYIWCLNLPYYRTLGVIMALVLLAVSFLGWSSLETRNSRRGLVTLIVIAAALKLAHWGYYVPEWNYRYSQGPWACAIAQWLPRRWTLYTLHEWPPDLAFFTKRRVRQLQSPHYLAYEQGIASKYLLLLPSEFDNWPSSAPPISLVARFQDQHAGERVLARTHGFLPPPFGPQPTRTNLARTDRNPAAAGDARR